MIAYFQGQSYHYLTNSINCLWIGTALETVRIQYEVTDDGLSIMSICYYHFSYRPWEFLTGFTKANPNEIAAVLEEAMNGMERMRAASVQCVGAHLQ